MITEKKIPSTRVSNVARLMADDSSCVHSVWFQSRHSSSIRANGNGRDPIDHNPRRTSLVHRTAAGLEERGDDVYPSLRNAFESRGSRSGARVTGRPDLITRSADGTITVYDVRDGEPGAADDLKVKLYMYLLPRSNHGRWHGTRPDGCVLYADGTERRVASDEVDEKFAERVASVMRQIASDEPARYMPSAQECGRCLLTGDDCSERIEAEPRSPDSPRSGHPHSTC